MRRTLTFVLPLLCAACAVGPEYPLDRPGTWRATGANDFNLQTMVANPGDLVRGRAAATDRGNAGALAATRLFVERRRPLIRETSSSVAAQQQQVQDAPLPGLDAGAGSAQGAPGGTAFALPSGGPVLVAPVPAAAPAAQ
jgi:hypothetical protein